MKQAKLEDLFDYLPKSKIKAGDGLEKGKYPFYTSSENQSKYLNDFQHGPGCLVFGTGGKASVHLMTSNFATSTDCITIKPKPTVGIDAGYVFQYFKGNMQVLENGFKGAGLKHISKAYLSNIQIPHPEEVADQIRIAHLLGKVEGLIAQRKQHLQQLDGLLKSVFLEMFGPTSQGYEGWPLVEIRDLAAKHKGAMRTGPFGSNLLHSEFSAEGDVAVLGIDNAVQNRFVWDERRFITNEKYKELENYRIFPGDVIVTIMGTIGRSAVVPNDIPLAINTKHLAAITLNRDLANPLFLSYSIHSSPFIFNQLRSKNRGAIMSGLNLGLIKETKLKRPPIELQNKFAETHTLVDELKAMYQHSLTDLETLYGALSQQAFKGELDLSRIEISQSSSIKVPPQESLPAALDATPQTIELPELPLELTLSGKGRATALQYWFEAALKSMPNGGTLQIEKLIDAINFRLIVMDDQDFEFDGADYEVLKLWVLEALKTGKLAQAFDDASNRIQLKAIPT